MAGVLRIRATRIRQMSLVWVFAAVLTLGLSLTVAFPVGAGTDEPLVILSDTTLTTGVPGGIVIAADDVTLDCAGHVVSGGRAIQLDGRSGVTIQNCVADGFAIGIELTRSSGNTIASNTLYGW